MAMLRNLRNMITKGISEAHHKKILSRLTNKVRPNRVKHTNNTIQLVKGRREGVFFLYQSHVCVCLLVVMFLL